MLADQTPDLHEALEQAKKQGPAQVIPDGKIFSTDRRGEKTTSVKDKQIDLWYPGKAHEHGGNVQALSGPDGLPLWVTDVEPGTMHDLTVAREHAPGALHWTAAHLDLPTLADSDYEGAEIGVHTPTKKPAGDQVLDADNRTYNALDEEAVQEWVRNPRAFLPERQRKKRVWWRRSRPSASYDCQPEPRWRHVLYLASIPHRAGIRVTDGPRRRSLPCARKVAESDYAKGDSG